MGSANGSGLPAGPHLAGNDLAHNLVTSFVHTGENPGAAGGTSSGRPASISSCLTPPAPPGPGSADLAWSLASELSSSAAYRVTASASSRPKRHVFGGDPVRPGLVIVMSAGPSWMVRIGGGSG